MTIFRLKFPPFFASWGRFLAVLLLGLACGNTPVMAAAVMAKEGERVPVQGSLDYLPASTAIDTSRLLAGDYDEQFLRYDDNTDIYRAEPVWLRLRIANSTTLDHLVLSLNNVLYTDALLLYNRAPAGEAVDMASRELGFLYGPIRQDWPYYDIGFRIDIAANQTRTVYLRLHTPCLVQLQAYVTDEHSYDLYQMEQGSWGHLMVGIMLGVLLYLVMIALFVPGLREVRYCIGFVMVSFLIMIYIRGYLLHMLPHIPWLKLHLYPALFATQALTYIAFSRQHFKTGLDFPHIDRLLQAGQYLAAAQLLASVVLPILWSVNAVIAMVFLLVALLCICSVYVWANSQRHLSTYITGTLSFLLACILITAESAGFIDLGGHARVTYEAGICLQTILFALALAEKISDYQQSQTRLAVNAAEAQAENRAKSSFLAKMSHELRTPMNGLLGMLQLLERTPLNDQQQHYLQVMQNSGRLLLGVIDDVLDYSRIVAGKLRIEEQDYDLTEVIADVEAMFTPAARQKMLHLHFSITNHATCVCGDVTRLRQILINLTGNAIKFTEEGSVSLRLWVEQCNDAQWLLHGEVEDTGVGITDEQMKRLFREYEQADGAKSYGGSGLGLVICKQLVEMMGGNIHAESAPGYGSVFRFQIAVKPPQGRDRKTRTTVLDGPEMRANSAAHILVAEDNETNREVVLALLEQLGYRAECVATGMEAVAAVCRDDANWDLVLMDVEMPILDGLAATRQIRQWEAEQYRNTIPIIALTAHAIHGYEEKTRLAGMDDHLSKPIDMNLLRDMLARWLPEPAQKIHPAQE